MLTSFISSILAIFGKMGLTGVFFLMTIESTFLPLPSELIIPPVAYLASQGKMSLVLIIIAGTFGSVFGAMINYFLAITLGRVIIYGLARKKIARILFINEKKIQEAEDYFLEYGNISTFLGRFIPGIRHLISIPAGLAKMKLFNFILFTFLGASIWCTVLAMLGYFFGAKQQLIMSSAKEISYGVALFSFMLIIYSYWRKKRKRTIIKF